ncbi:MAG: prepilin-type N-terminal cleavage/methylation domain-containing protein [Deltaproteobacteria bacterium]|nr:prepilin-type N-terminal cleavage/methylation domain-containing protein [Deltaproteobacteria bacterium]
MRFVIEVVGTTAEAEPDRLSGRHLQHTSLIRKARSTVNWGFRRVLRSEGVTLVELMISVAIIATLAGIAAPIFGSYVDKARSAKAVSDIRTTLEAGITLYEFTHEVLPTSLADINRGSILDPWGNTYQYLNLVAGGPGVRGHARKDRFLVPLNSDYDLYSMGKDGRSVAPLTSRWSRDDILRANDGSFVGSASDF